MSDNATEHTVIVTVTLDNGDEFSSGAKLDGLVSQMSSGRRSAIAEALRELADELEAYESD